MPLYLMLGNMNVTARAELSEDANIISRAANRLGGEHGRFLTSYASLGRFDYVLIAEADGPVEAASLSLKLSNATGMSIETVPIISAEQLHDSGRGEPAGRPPSCGASGEEAAVPSPMAGQIMRSAYDQEFGQN